MAKDTGVNKGLFSKTEIEQSEDYTLDQEYKDQEGNQANPVNAKGVGLRQLEWDYIDQIAGELGQGVTGHSVAVYLLRNALKRYRKGEIEIPTKTTPKTTIG
jgi:hypothetical protein